MFRHNSSAVGLLRKHAHIILLYKMVQLHPRLASAVENYFSFFPPDNAELHTVTLQSFLKYALPIYGIDVILLRHLAPQFLRSAHAGRCRCGINLLGTHRPYTVVAKRCFEFKGTLP
jgi:hypothetical protein